MTVPVLSSNDSQQFGLIYDSLKPRNGLFDEYHAIQIADLKLSKLDWRESVVIAGRMASKFEAPEMRSDEERTPKMNVLSFALILFEIVVGCQHLERQILQKSFGSGR
jgi:hypothetical protein